jgi:hypothetical protein
MADKTPETGKKNTRKPLPYQLLAKRLDKEGKVIGYDIVQSPPNVRADRPLRKDFERGVLAELEAGTNVEVYNDRPFCVAQIGETFRFKAAVKEEVIRKVTVQKV